MNHHAVARWSHADRGVPRYFMDCDCGKRFEADTKVELEEDFKEHQRRQREQ